MNVGEETVLCGQLHKCHALCIISDAVREGGGDVRTFHNIALPVFLSGSQCQTAAFTEQCAGYFSAA